MTAWRRRSLGGALAPVTINGVAEATIPASFCLVNSIRLQFFLVYELDALERSRAVAAINRALEQGKLINRVSRPIFKLADAVAAHEAVEKGTIGNVIVTI